MRSSSDPYYHMNTLEDFSTYVSDVLGNEWIPSWNLQSLQAGALAIKDYAWYEMLHPDYSSPAVQRGADITDYKQYDQTYIKDSHLKYPSVIAACSNMEYQALLDNNGYVLYGRYVAGTQGQIGSVSDGIMRQWGTEYMAISYAWDYFTICSTYYSYTPTSPAYIQEVTLN